MYLEIDCVCADTKCTGKLILEDGRVTIQGEPCYDASIKLDANELIKLQAKIRRYITKDLLDFER